MPKSIHFCEKQCLRLFYRQLPLNGLPLLSFLEENLETPPPSIIFQEAHPSYKLAALHYGVCVFVPVCVIEQKGIRMF